MDADRLRRGWTFSNIADEAGISVPTVSRFFAGERRSPKTAKKIALALGYPVGRYVRDAEVAA